MSDISAQLKGLSPDKLRLLAQQLRERKASPSRIVRQSRESNCFPLSFAQQRIWFMDQISPGNIALNISMAYRFDTRVDVAALKKSFNLMAQRHEILRTTFAIRDGQPVQLIAPSLEIELPLIDLSHKPAEERESLALQLADEEARTPFNLETGPLMRAKVVKLGEEDYVLLWAIHHIAFDGSSGFFFGREQGEAYEAFRDNKPLPTREPAIQYADFAAWQRQWLQGDRLDKLLSFWRDRLANVQMLNLPTDYPRPKVYSFEGETRSLIIAEDMIKALDALSRRSGVTLFTTLLAAFKLLLSRYTSQSDIVLGTALAGRNQLDTEEMIGVFVNTLVLRTDLSGNPTFLELLKRVHQMWVDSFAHQDMPFEVLVKDLNPERDLSHQPIFQVMFHFNTTPMSFGYQDEDCGSLPGGTSLLNGGTALFDLTFSIEPAATTTHAEEGAFKCVMEYNTDLFKGATIVRMLGHYCTLLQSILSNPEHPVLDLLLITEAERDQLLIQFNNTDTNTSVTRCIPQLFEEQVAATPDNIAVLSGDQRITYRELNAQANRLAHYLRRLGVKAETMVGVHMERSAELVIAILAILKAGGAYSPLDPTLPKERLTFMLDDLRVPVVLTRAAFKDELVFAESNPRVVCLDSEDTIASESSENPDVCIAAGNIAYVIYTSGSTGRPKGVLIDHGSIAMHSLYARECYGLEPADRALQFFQISLDGSLEQIFSTLIAGAGLVLRDAELWTPFEFRQKIEEYGISIVNPLPAYLRQVLRGLAGEQETFLPAQLKLVMLGGDAMLPEDILLLRQGPVSTDRLMHCYGPTEATIYATNLEIPAEIEGTYFARKVPIGCPVDDRKVYILDSRLNPVPVGVPGEIYLGGDGLARGYLNRPDPTAEVFLPDPFSQKPGMRMYKTGDLARYLPDGNIDFLGRLDHQVKIRGYRIELGEIERSLADHPGLSDVLVAAKEDAQGNKRIIGYAVKNGNPPPTGSELREFLRKKLPDYMVPSAFVMLDVFPITPNGKIDREALPVPSQEQQNAYVPPGTQIEEALASIWEKVLGVEKVGIHDNFFELGGDSILAIQIVAKANQLGIGITQRQIFRQQTIAELAEVAGTPLGTESEEGRNMSDIFPLTPIQGRFFEQNLSSPHHFNQTFLFECDLPLDADLLGKAVLELLAHHDALRLRFVLKEEGWHQFYASANEAAPVHLVDLSTLSDAEQRAALEAKCAELQAGHNLSDGPIICVALFDTGPQKTQRLFITIHHLAVDVVSWRVILEDLADAYTQLSRGERVMLPAKTTSFKRWAERLSESAQSEHANHELGYWQAALTKEATRLPVDYPAGENIVESEAIITVELDEEETRHLLRDVPKAYRVQSPDILLTAVVNAFANWTGSRRLMIDLESHGRADGLFEGVDVSRTVGWFTSLYPVTLEVGEEESESLKQVKQQLREIPREGIGYGLLRYGAGIKNSAEQMRSLPQSEVSFNYLGQLDQVVSASPIFKLAEESNGPAISGSERRPHLLDLTGWVLSGRLYMSWTYSKNIHRHSTIEAVAQNFIKSLRSLITDCLSQRAVTYTPADFSQVDLNQSELDDLIAKLNISLE